VKRFSNQASVYSAKATTSAMPLADNLSTIQWIKNNNKNRVIQHIIRNLHNDDLQHTKASKETLTVDNLLLKSQDAVAHVKKMPSIISKRQIPKGNTRKEQIALARYTWEAHRYKMETLRAGHVHHLCEIWNLPRRCQHILLHCTDNNTA
jgi:hypothetical protein